MAECYRPHILDLPDELIFYIFSYLDEREQIIFGRVCQHWYIIANDQSHWSRLLLRDIGIWNISKVSSCLELSEYHAVCNNGQQMKAVVWDPFVVSKTIFTMCSPKILAKKRRLKFMRENQLESSLISKVKSLVLKSTKVEEVIPKLIMFGPGLETIGISIIARKILKGQSSLFLAVGLISGGVIAVKYERQLIHFSLLYSNTKALRRPLPAQERLNSSKLFAKVSEDVWVPTDPVKLACQGCNCIVYVIDATVEIENIDDPFPDLTLIIQQSLQYQRKKQTEEDGSEHPLFLMVLACLPEENSPRPDWQQLLYGLNLWKYGIPWQVSLIIASNLANISIPFDWAVSRMKCL